VETALIGWTLEIGLDLIGLALGSVEYRGFLVTGGMGSFGVADRNRLRTLP